MSVVWVLLLAGSFAAAVVTGRVPALTAAITSSAGAAVTLALGLIGVMSLWLGLMRVAEEAGLIRILARLARPVMCRLFPEVPPDHPAMGAMLMNIGANLLGLGNAATPFGVDAMRKLEELNARKGSASNAQVLFCAMNTASLQLVPATIIALRASAGAHAPAEVIAPTLVATACALTAAITAAKGLAHLRRRRAATST